MDFSIWIWYGSILVSALANARAPDIEGLCPAGKSSSQEGPLYVVEGGYGSVEGGHGNVEGSHGEVEGGHGVVEDWAGSLSLSLHLVVKRQAWPLLSSTFGLSFFSLLFRLLLLTHFGESPVRENLFPPIVWHN